MKVAPPTCLLPCSQPDRRREECAWGTLPGKLGLRVSSGSLGGLWAGRLPSLLGPDARPVLFQGHSPALQPSVSWQRHSRPVPSRAAWSLSLGCAAVDTRMGPKPQDAASHPHLLWEDGTGRRQAPLKPKGHRSPEHRGDIQRGQEQRPLAISSARLYFM